MSIDYCNNCEHVVEGDVIVFICPDCEAKHRICRHCHESDVTSLPEDDPREER